MGRRHPDLVFVPDDTRIITYSELLAAYDEHGSVRAVAESFGRSTSSVWRHLVAAGADLSGSPGEVVRLRARVAELEQRLEEGAKP